MSRQAFAEQLSGLELDGTQAASRDEMLRLLATERCFYRDCFPAHFTGSALVISHDGERVLLNHHRFLDRWLQFGGHCDGDEDIRRVAAREAEEESGLAGLQFPLAQPFDLDLHEIPANPKKGEPPHWHYDVRYLLVAPAGSTFIVSEESHDLRWFTPAEAAALEPDESVRRMLEKWRDHAAAGLFTGA